MFLFCIGGGHWILVTDLANKNFLVYEKLKVCAFLIFRTMNSRLNAKIVSSGHSRRSYRRVKKRTEAETSDFTKRIRFSASTDVIPFCSALKSLFFSTDFTVQGICYTYKWLKPKKKE